MNYYISPSLLAADYTCLGAELKKVADAGAEMIHIDIMDGVFVPNLSFGLSVVEALRPKSDIIFDVHLMIIEPHKYIKRFADAGADIITFHYESKSNIDETIELIRSTGAKVSMSISPDTPAEVLFPYLDRLDMLLVMTVHPGFGGQKLIPECLGKVRTLRRYAEEHGINIDIEVDGGITLANINDAYDAGANVIVAGSSVFLAQDVKATIAQMKKN